MFKVCLQGDTFARKKQAEKGQKYKRQQKMYRYIKYDAIKKQAKRKNTFST